MATDDERDDDFEQEDYQDGSEQSGEDSDGDIECNNPKNAAERKYNFDIQNRKYVRTKVTKSCKYIRNNLEELSSIEKSDKKTELINLKEKLNKYDDLIGKLIWKFIDDRTKLNRELDRVDHYTNEISHVLKLLDDPYKPEVGLSLIHI